MNALPPVCASFDVLSCLAESVHFFTLRNELKKSSFVTLDNSARKSKMHKMMSLNCSICSMSVFELQKNVEFGPPKFFFRPTPYGFRQVVQHVSKHFAY